MATRTFVPEAGDIVWLQFDPQAGHEQAGHRPALVLCCPLTTKVKGYPFEVLADLGDQAGAVLADQVKSLDWRIRKAKRKGAVSKDVLQDVRAKIKALLQIQ